MTNTHKFIKISPAQAVWASQSGKAIFKKDEHHFFEILDPKKMPQNQHCYIFLKPKQAEQELIELSNYQTSMILFGMMNLVSIILIAFNINNDFNSLMFFLEVSWILSVKTIISKTLKFKREKSSRKNYYLFGKSYF